jgi:hypothetical protein
MSYTRADLKVASRESPLQLMIELSPCAHLHLQESLLASTLQEDNMSDCDVLQLSMSGNPRW